jgi:hypothetical protein
MLLVILALPRGRLGHCNSSAIRCGFMWMSDGAMCHMGARPAVRLCAVSVCIKPQRVCMTHGNVGVWARLLIFVVCGLMCGPDS